MEKAKMKVFELCEMKDSLMHWAREHKDNADIQSMGQVIDMIKDLGEAEKDCWEACYYKSVVEAMKKAEEEDKVMGRMGYDNWRYSSGRFAPTGRGHYSGYTPTYDDQGMDMSMDWDFQNPRMGYSSDYGSGSRSSSENGSRSGRAGGSYRSGYDRYRKARMGYRASGSAEDREEMSSAAKEHVEEMAESMRDIWVDADPSLRKELKSHLTSLIGELS